MAYTVQPGDTMKKIAKAHGLTTVELIVLNPQIGDPNLIHPGDLIILSGGSVSGPHPFIYDDNQTIEGIDFVASGRALHIDGADNVTVRNCRIFNSGRGLSAHNSTNVTFENNLFVDVGFHPIQFDKVQGGHIRGNVFGNKLGESSVVDMISVFGSHDIVVEDNYATGGGPSQSGSGIMVGDGGGSNITVRNNRLENPGQVGIGVAGGEHITVENNTVFGEKLAWSNVGIYVWDQSGGPCVDITIRDNDVDWTNRDGINNPFWDGGNCGTVLVEDNSWQ